MRKIIIAAVILGLPRFLMAQSLLSVPGLATVISDYAKQAKAVGLVDLDAKFSGGAFLPVRTLKDTSGIAYVELGPGAAIKQGENLKGGVLIDFNLSALVRKLEGKSAWYAAHVDKIVLPDVYVGPYFFPALDADFRWDRWRQYVGGVASIRL